MPQKDPIEVHPPSRGCFVEAPANCQRCNKRPATVSRRDKATGHVSFICITCKNKDKSLRDLPIKPKTHITYKVPDYTK